MSNFKIHPDKSTEIDVEDSVESSLYTIFGKHDWLDNGEDSKSAQIHAKLSGSKMYVKRGRHGHLFNPIGLYSEGTEYKQKRHAGKPEWELKPVNKKAFDFYINFLKTKNVAWLRNAEREI